MGYIPKALEKSHSEHPGLHAVLTVCLIFLSFLDVLLCCLLPVFVNTQPPCLHTNSRHVLLRPRCTTKAIGSEKSVLWWCRLGAGYT